MDAKKSVVIFFLACHPPLFALLPAERLSALELLFLGRFEKMLPAFDFLHQFGLLDELVEEP